jgi:hypothetical protein
MAPKILVLSVRSMGTNASGKSAQSLTYCGLAVRETQ